MDRTSHTALIPTLTSALAATPAVLEEMLAEVPEAQLKAHRIPDKWSIHEHACHIAIGDRYVLKPRLKAFIQEEHPQITPYSGDSFAPDHLLNLDLEETLSSFRTLRQESIRMIESFPAELWHKEAQHPEYIRYSPYILLRHFLMHDHYHLYRIEELGLSVQL